MSEKIIIRPTPTPNPSTVKFIVNHKFMEFGGRDFPKKETAEGSPLAEKLWALPGVGGVFIGSDFITITETPDCDWGVLGDAVMDCIRKHIESGDQHVKELEKTAAEIPANMSEIEAKIREILDAEIRPAVAMDGGDITFEGYEQGMVLLHMKGSCSGCPSSTATLRIGIESRLREVIPEIQGVISV
ncbi:MAG: Fe/S biogenesis protein NfuA [Myxococcota bacterium]|nr:Fe/S biogenesis protein NfuA [Myxococcota bacterium]